MVEMSSIIEIIASTGLVPDSIRIWQEIPYVWADQLYGESSRRIARYLFTCVDAAKWQWLDDWGEQFVSEVIEPVYFLLANDASWNLYWVNVLNETELRRIDTQQRIAFSSNTEYTRNLMVSLEHLAASIPVGRISAGTTDEEMVQPDDVWATQLEGTGLGFCLDEYAKKNLEDYLAGNSGGQRKTPLSEKAVDSRHIAKLQSIVVPKAFRTHCYPKDWTIPLQSVNLLYGFNGSGKTSLLSAIELAITGEVRSLAENAAQSVSTQTRPLLLAEAEQHPMELTPPQSPAEKKVRERLLYRSRSAKRFAPQLQSLFHRFNYLSAEETFLFATDQPDLLKIFSRILFGPEIQDMWRNLGRYKSECASMAAKYKQRLEFLNNQIESLGEVPQADESSFRAYLAASGLGFDWDAAPKEILAETQKILAEYDKVQNLAPILSQNQLSEAQTIQAEQHQAHEAKIQEISETLNQAKTTEDSLMHEAQEWMERVSSAEKAVASLRALEPLAKQLQFRADYADWFAYYQTGLAEQSICEKTINQLRHLIEKYEPVLETPPQAEPRQLREQARKVQGQRTGLQKRWEYLGQQIVQKELAQEKQTALFSSLSSAGLEIYQLDESRHVCPLCGTEGITVEVLRRHLEEESAQGDQQLQSLYQERLEASNLIKDAESALKTLNQQEIIAQTYGEALRIVQKDFPEVQNAAGLYRAYRDAKKKQDAWKEKIENVRRYLWEELKAAGTSGTIEEICESRQRLLDTVPTAYAALDPDASDDELTAAFVTFLREWEEKKAEYDQELLQKQAVLKRQHEIVEQLHKALNQKEDQLEELNRDILRLNQSFAFWKAVGKPDTDWTLSGEAVKNLCENLHKQARAIIAFTENKNRKAVYQEEIADIQKKLKRCYTLQTTLESLQSPDSYADAFIRQNVNQISRIFLALHSPQEFSRLDIENQQLVAFRNEEKVPISHMSTGQRTALVIAVFFQMNLATPSAPGFLLLDEPVANIDDLNVLALMDFLREIALTHQRQIFFTTANRNVAKLFRRKFSFLESDFQELWFFRENEHCLQITKRIYDQNRLLESTKL